MKQAILFLLAALLPVCSSAQSIAITDTLTLNQYLEELFGAGVTISNVTVQGDTNNAIGYFSGGNGIGLPEGIIISTGHANSANTTPPNGGSVLGQPGDADLAAISGGITHDAFVLEFDIESDCDEIIIEYVFGSKEYPSFVGFFNDVFAFLISGPGYSVTKNIALIPGTNTPVSINTVNNANGCTNCQYYVSNVPSISGTSFNGYTTPLQAVASVIPDSTYHIKIAIADVSDYAFDSGVFLRRKGVCANANLVAISSVESVGNTIQTVEGEVTTIGLERSLPFDQALTVSISTMGTIDTATDLVGLPSTVTIPAGEAGVNFDLTFGSDCEVEGIENLAIVYTDSSLTCAGQIHSDTLWITVMDGSPLMPNFHLGQDTAGCVGDTLKFTSVPSPEFAMTIFPQPMPFVNDYWVIPGNDSTVTEWILGGTLTHLATGCSVSDTVNVTAYPAPRADMILPEVVCDAQPFEGLDASSGFVQTYEWTFFSSASAIWTYNSPDVSVQLMPLEWKAMYVVGNAYCGTDTIEKSVQIHPAVLYSGSLPDTVCLDEEITWDLAASDSTIFWNWNFGNGFSSANAAPTYAYQDTGTYSIEVISGFAGCEDTTVQSVVVEACAVNGLALPQLDLRVYPNPADRFIQIDGLAGQESHIRLYNLEGRAVWQKVIPRADRGYVPVENLANGLYLLEVRQQSGAWTGKVEVKK